jgi:hypothetical protein
MLWVPCMCWLLFFFFLILFIFIKILNCPLSNITITKLLVWKDENALRRQLQKFCFLEYFSCFTVLLKWKRVYFRPKQFNNCRTCVTSRRLPYHPYHVWYVCLSCQISGDKKFLSFISWKKLIGSRHLCFGH